MKTKRLYKILKDQSKNINALTAVTLAGTANTAAVHNLTGDNADAACWDKIRTEASASEATEAKENETVSKARKEAAAAKAGIVKLRDELKLTKKELKTDIRNCRNELKSLKNEAAEMKKEIKRLRKDTEVAHKENKVLRKLNSEMVYAAYGVYIKKASKLLRHFKRHNRNNAYLKSISQNQNKLTTHNNYDVIDV